VDRTKDHLSSSDVAIIHSQRILLERITAVAAGRTPRGARPGMDHRGVVPVNLLRPVGTADSSQVIDYYASAK
jgi:hypothetical protein